MYDWWFEKDAPSSHSRNPVQYVADAADRRAQCACDCGAPVAVGGGFLPGHEKRAVFQRINKRWGGTDGFIRWFDGRDAA